MSDRHRLSITVLFALTLGLGACAGTPHPVLPTNARPPQPTGGTSTPRPSNDRLGPLFFDPQGADFTSWVNAFKNEVYRRWLIPQSAAQATGAQLDLEFTVVRNGTLSSVRILHTSGYADLDQAAERALRTARLPALPETFPAPQVTMQMAFSYNMAPSREPRCRTTHR